MYLCGILKAGILKAQGILKDSQGILKAQGRTYLCGILGGFLWSLPGKAGGELLPHYVGRGLSPHRMECSAHEATPASENLPGSGVPLHIHAHNCGFVSEPILHIK